MKNSLANLLDKLELNEGNGLFLKGDLILVMTKKQFDLATYFDNSPATVKRIQRAATMKSKAKYKNVYSKFQAMLNNNLLDIDELVAQYYKILDNTPLSLRTKKGVDYEFVKWLINIQNFVMQ